MSFFEWKPNMSVGNALIDNDHRKLVHYVNEMHHAMMGGRGREIVGPILDKLVAYTKEHFGREEIIWKAGRYADFELHKRQHEQLLKTVADFHAKYAAGTAALSVDVMNFLRDWLKNHILKADKEAADAIAAGARSRAKPPPTASIAH